jgi:hypothetical protein
LYTQEAKYYPDYTIKSFKEFNNGNLLYYEEYDLFGNMTYQQMGEYWGKYTYNHAGKFITEKLSSGSQVIIEYHRNGYGKKKSQKTIDKEGNWYITEYNKNGGLIKSYDCFGNERNF